MIPPMSTAHSKRHVGQAVRLIPMDFSLLNYIHEFYIIIYIYTYTCMCIYIYIYTHRNNDTNNNRQCTCMHMLVIIVMIYIGGIIHVYQYFVKSK